MKNSFSSPKHKTERLQFEKWATCETFILNLTFAVFSQKNPSQMFGRALNTLLHSLVFLGKDVQKICCRFTVEQPCRRVISVKFQSNFFEITLRHECSPIILLHIFRTSFHENTYGRLHLCIALRNILKFHLICWCVNFGKTNSFG